MVNIVFVEIFFLFWSEISGVVVGSNDDVCVLFFGVDVFVIDVVNVCELVLGKIRIVEVVIFFEVLVNVYMVFISVYGYRCFILVGWIKW